MDPQVADLSAPTATCALHFGQPFTAVCTRCGAYMCQTCSEGGRLDLCPACRQRLGVGAFPLRRDQFSWQQLFDLCGARYKQHWGVLAVGLLIVGVGIGLVNAAGAIVQALFPDQWVAIAIVNIVMLVPQFVVQGFLTLGLVSLALRMMRGEQVDLGMLFGEWKHVGGFIIQSILANLAMLTIVLFMAIPVLVGLLLSSPAIGIGIGVLTTPLGGVALAYVMVGFMFGTAELVGHPGVSAVDALRNSWQIARGMRLRLVAASFVMGALVVAGLMFCLIGALFTGGLAVLVYAAMYLALRPGEGDLAG